MQIAFILSILKWVQRWQVPWIRSILTWVLGVSGGEAERWKRKRGRADLLSPSLWWHDTQARSISSSLISKQRSEDMLKGILFINHFLKQLAITRTSKWYFWADRLSLVSIFWPLRDLTKPVNNNITSSATIWKSILHECIFLSLLASRYLDSL